MSFRSLNDANNIYEIASSATISWEIVENALLERYSGQILALQRDLRGEDEEPTWLEALRLLRSVRSVVSASPLPFGHPGNHLNERLVALSELQIRIRAQYGAATIRLFDDAYFSAAQLSTDGSNPLGERAIEISSSVASGKKGILIPVARIASESAQYFRHRPGSAGVKFIIPSDFADLQPFESLVVIGSTKWYQKYGFVFSAPRAKHVHLLKWSWVNDSIPSPNIFLDSRSGSLAAPTSPPSRRLSSSLEGSELVPTVDWDAITARIGREVDEDAELTDARILLLAGGWAVAVDGNADASIRVIEPELIGDQRIQEIPSSDLDVGDYVLLRTHGGGELIEALADQSLGARSTQLRARQREWKTKLKGEVNASSIGEVIKKLKDYGSQIADYSNLRNWQSARNLRTSNPKDFSAIMRLIGQQEDTAKVWTEMGELQSAHLRAGFYIARLLRSVIADADLDTLVSTGSMEFHLPGQRIGSLTASCVEAVGPTTVIVSENLLGRRIPAEDIWLG